MTLASTVPAAPVVWRACRFDELALRELHRILAVRQRVFVLEQQCVFLDVDDCDERAFHLAAWSPVQIEPLAYARILDPGMKYAEASIGRVLTSESCRGRGLGRETVRRAIAVARGAWPGAPIRIAAQSRLERFYASFGFVAVGEPYEEDGIDHTDMVLTAQV